MIKKEDEQKVVEEDILRTLGEKNGDASLKSLMEEVQSSGSAFSRAIENIEKKNLIRLENNRASLTDKGIKKADDILRKHLVVENYFKESRGAAEAHSIAHIFEHRLSEEAIKNMESLYNLREKGEPLLKLKPYEEGLIVNIALPDSKLFERVVSMGIFIGEKVTVAGKIPGGVIIKIKNKKFVVDKNIAEYIRVIKNG